MVVPGSPGCFPGRRFPRSRSDRSRGFFRYGLSDDGGRDDIEESLPDLPLQLLHPRLQPADQLVRLRQLPRQLGMRQRGQLLRRGIPGTPGTARKPAPQPARSQQPATACRTIS